MSENNNNNNTPVAPVVPPTTPEAKAPTPEVRRLKLQIDGQEHDLSEQEVIALAQQGKSAGKRFQEAAQMRKETEAVVNMLKSDPKAALAKFGIDVRKFSEETLMELLQREAETPQQKQQRENEEELRRYKKAEKDAQDKKQFEEMTALEEKHLKNYNDMFVKALQDSGLPKTQFTVKRMAELQLINVKKGLDLDASQLAKIVKDDYINEQKALFGASDGESLMAILGPEALKKLSKAQIAKLKSATPKFQSNKEDMSEPKGEQKLTWKDFQKKNRGY